MEKERLTRELGLFSATAVVVANMIGTGIFTTSGFILEQVDNSYALLACWLVGGMFALSGALCYGELGAMFPRAGGEYVFLRESFGKATAFLSGWISLIVGFSAPIAASAIAFATYFFRILPVPLNLNFTLRVFGEPAIVLTPVTVLAVIIIVVFALLHHHSLRLGSSVQNGLALLTVAVIMVFILGGIFFGQCTLDNLSKPVHADTFFSSAFAVSLVFVSFSYSGWNAAAYMGGEIKNPGRAIPRALIMGCGLVAVLYFLLNGAFLAARPAEDLKGVLDVAASAGQALFGPAFSLYLNGAIAFSILSAVSSMTMTGPRVYYAMAADGSFFQLFSRISRRRTPSAAILLQAAIAIAMTLTASFATLLIYIGFTLAASTMLAVAGMMLLRKKTPDAPRPYRTFGYPVTPLFFILGNLWIISFAVSSKPGASLAGLLTIGTGFAVYAAYKRAQKKAA